MINLPDDVKYIIDKIYEAGFEAYAVGGCVRDSLLGKSPKDWDITTSALPDRIAAIFGSNRIIPSGIKHGTVTLVKNKQNYEITTFRLDGTYSDGRRPDNVSFAANLKEDLSRRDFTVNAMAYNDRVGLADYFSGREDLENKLIRCVGDAKERFSEDYLRMLRAYRFSCVLGFKMHETVLAACRSDKERIKNISAERIREELEKILLSDDTEGIELFLRDYSPVILPEVAAMQGVSQNTKYHRYDVFTHTVKVIEASERTAVMRLAALLHDTGKALTRTTDENGEDHFRGHEEKSAEICKRILTGLKYDNDTIKSVYTCVKYHGVTKKLDRAGIRALIYKVGYENARNILAFAAADTLGKSDYSIQSSLGKNRERLETYKDICEKNEPCELKALKITGNDIMALSQGARGAKVGKVLDALMKVVLNDPQKNDEKTLTDAAEELLNDMANTYL